MIDEKKLIEDIVKEFVGVCVYYVAPSQAVTDFIEIVDRQPIIDKQPRVGEWIPCSERLPEKNKAVLVYVLDAYEIAYLDDAEDWIHCMGTFYKDEVEAWMPLPPAYKEGE